MIAEIPILEQPPQENPGEGVTLIAAALSHPALVSRGVGSVCAHIFQQSMSLACRREKIKLVTESGTFAPTYALWCAEVEDVTSALEACFRLMHETKSHLLMHLAQFDKASKKWISANGGPLGFKFDVALTSDEIRKCFYHIAVTRANEEDAALNHIQQMDNPPEDTPAP